MPSEKYNYIENYTYAETFYKLCSSWCWCHVSNSSAFSKYNNI